MAEKIINKSISDELKTSYLNYAMSVIVSRALPDVRDGLKPVHRRILYVMGLSGLSFSKPYKKSATVVGNVIASYHPHGDQAIYDSLVRMAQDFSLRYVLVDGQGNFGSLDGDKAAAHRYTEARMTKISDEMLRDLNKDTVDFANNFDDSTTEPTVLPAAIPNLLINGSSGIAVGMATNIPPHNLQESIDAVIHKIDYPESDSLELMQHIKGPDFPTGGIIHGVNGLKQAYTTGRGSFKIRSRVEIEAYKKDREAIIITEIPYQVNKAVMVTQFAGLVKAERIKGVSEIRDESSRKGIRVVIELKSGVNPQTILNVLYKESNLEISYGINAVAIVNGIPKVLDLETTVKCFIKHRFEVVTRKARFELKKAEDRLHIVDGFVKIALPNIKLLVELIQKSKNAEEAKKKLIAEFKFSEKQVTAVLEMRLIKLVGLEILKLEEEQASLLKIIGELKTLLGDPKNIYAKIKGALLEVKESYADERRTEISLVGFEELTDADLIPKEDMVVSITNSGYIKRLPLDTYRTQGRGGTGVRALSGDREKDQISQLFAANTHDHVMFITNLGKAYYLRVFEIQVASRIAKGSHIRSLINLEVDETVQGYLLFNDIKDDKSFVMATKNGVVKRCKIHDFRNAKKRGIQAITMKEENDEVVALTEVESEEDFVMVYSAAGLAVKTSAKNIRVMGRGASGVRGIRLEKGDTAVGIVKANSNEKMFIVTENGLGKKVSYDEFMPKGRGGKGQFYLKTDDKSGKVVSVLSVGDDSDILIVTSLGNLIRLNTEDISELKRMARGYKVIQLKEAQDKVISAARLNKIDESGKELEIKSDEK